MDFRYPAEAEAFRTEFRGWLDVNLPTRSRAAGSADRSRWKPPHSTRCAPGTARSPTRATRRSRGPRSGAAGARASWTRSCTRRRCTGPSAPGTLNPLGLSNIAPAIIEHGTDEQKRTLLPRMLRGDDIWCQGFSEPNAGSDLASLRTQAVLDGECWVVNGQKTWNTLGHMANWCELLVRTDPTVPKHKGITCLLVDMTLPGVEVRPLVTITGDKEFNEIFFTDVRVPVDYTLGPVNEGWRVAMTTLAYERGTVAKLHTGTRGKIARLIDEARTIPLGDGRMATEDPVIREKLAATYLDGELLKLISDRALSAELHGRAMGPEGSIAKLLWSETEQHVAELAADILGPDALQGSWARDRVYSRALTIAGGTTQVNKNILAQRMLGLPRH